MVRKIVVIASGETERQALPRLVEQYGSRGVILREPVRTPPHGRIDGEIAVRLVRAAAGELQANPPARFVVLVDTNGKDPGTVTGSIDQALLRLSVPVPVLVARATQHLESWFFADEAGLRSYFGGRSLGGVDPSEPDAIQAPKQHLRNLLRPRVYTARVAGEIAVGLSVERIWSKSPSFRTFEQALLSPDP